MKKLKPIDRQILKYSPDQFTLRLNEMVQTLNGMSQSMELPDPNSSTVLVFGAQPDKTFGIASWKKTGGIYSLITRLI